MFYCKLYLINILLKHIYDIIIIIIYYCTRRFTKTFTASVDLDLIVCLIIIVIYNYRVHAFLSVGALCGFYLCI